MVVITSLTGYGIEHISTYVKSLHDTSFSGRKIALYYEPQIKVKNYLEGFGWEVVSLPKPTYYINFQRFYDVSNVIKNLNLQNSTICFTDIRDVFFKKSIDNLKLDFYIGADKFVPLYEHSWNADSIKKGFSNYYKEIKNNFPLCAGVIFGNGGLLEKFFNECFELGLISSYENLETWCPVDQAAVNVLAYTKYKSFLQTPKIEDKIVLNMVNIDTDNFDTNDYSIYHQYDRHKDFAKRLVN